MNLADRRDFYRWRPMACLRVSGEDTPRFLQGQYTNDLQKVKQGEAIYGLWLNQKGKVLADSFVQQKSDHEYWIVSYFSTAGVIRERLEAYIIADDVVIEDTTAEMTGLTIFDPALEAELKPAGGWSFSGRRDRVPHREIIFPMTEAAGLNAKLSGLTSLTSAEMERRRIAAGIPAVPADIGPADLPNEGGLEAEAISYTKGCYLGQEVMARLKSMGQVRRRLMRIRGAGKFPVTPAAVHQSGRKVGELRSAAPDGSGWLGLALVSLLQLKPKEPLVLQTEGSPEAFLVDEA